MNLSELRLTYTKAGLLESEADPDPIEQFRIWFEQARESGSIEPNAMTLATADAAGRPSARIVLLKKFDPNGFVFYTNKESRKGQELASNPVAALLFYWPELERQVRISGTVERVPESEADAYFASRPVGHRLGAWASQQSEVVEGREALQRNMEEIQQRFASGDIPRPPFWGGFLLHPVSIEFWQGRPNRLHDRLEYLRAGEVWEMRRLSP